MPQKKDSNHADLRDSFRDLGGSWLEIVATMSGGEPDACLGLLNQTELIEIKSPDASKARKNAPKQIAFRKRWRGRKIHQVETMADILELFGAASTPLTPASASGSRS